MDERPTIGDPVDAAIAVALRTGDQSAIASMLPPGTDPRITLYLETRKANVGRRVAANHGEKIRFGIWCHRYRQERGRVALADLMADADAEGFDLTANVMEAIATGRGGPALRREIEKELERSFPE